MKTRQLVFAFFIILVAIFSVGCGGNTSNNGDSSKNYTPHTLGSSWTYSSVSSGVTSSYTNLITVSTSTTYTEEYENSDAESSLTDFVISGNIWAEIKAVDYDSLGGVISTTTWNPPCPLFPAKTNIGTIESYFSTVSSGPTPTSATISFTVNGVESVTVPAGTFNALKVTSTYTIGSSPDTVWTSWYADGVGLIKTEDSYGVTELLSYSIK